MHGCTTMKNNYHYVKIYHSFIQLNNLVNNMHIYYIENSKYNNLLIFGPYYWYSGPISAQYLLCCVPLKRGWTDLTCPTQTTSHPLHRLLLGVEALFGDSPVLQRALSLYLLFLLALVFLFKNLNHLYINVLITYVHSMKKQFKA